MAKCPVCDAQVADDIGLVTCASCGAQVLLELDGSNSTAPAALENMLLNDPDVELDLGAMSAELPPIPANFGNGETSNIGEVISEDIFASPAPIVPPPAPPIEPGDMSDVAEFGNSSISQGREGLLRFNVSILGIDTGEVRKQISDILADSRFLWDAPRVMSKMHNGRIDIRDLTAVKASLLVQRLRAVPVEVFWEQYVIHQT